MPERRFPPPWSVEETDASRKLRARRPEFMATAQTMTATTTPEPRRLFAD
jgi:hypothetical protein